MSDPFKDFLEELERRRGNGTPEANASEPDSDAPPSRTRARRPGGSAPSGQRPAFKLGFRTLFLPTLLVLVLVAGPIIGLLTDARWFDSLGAGALYWQRLQLQGGLFVGGTLAALALLLVSLFVASLIARRLGGTPTGTTASSEVPREPRTPLMDDRGNLQPDGIVDALRGLFGADGDGAARSAGATIGSGALRIGAPRWDVGRDGGMRSVHRAVRRRGASRRAPRGRP